MALRRRLGREMRNEIGSGGVPPGSVVGTDDPPRKMGTWNDRVGRRTPPVFHGPLTKRLLTYHCVLGSNVQRKCKLAKHAMDVKQENDRDPKGGKPPPPRPWTQR